MYKEQTEVKRQQMNYLDGLRRFKDKGVAVLVDGLSVWKRSGIVSLRQERTAAFIWGILSVRNRAD